MKFKATLMFAATATLIGLAGCQTAEEIRAERAKKGEEAMLVTGSNLPRKNRASDVKVVSVDAIRSVEGASAAAAGAAAAKGK